MIRRLLAHVFGPASVYPHLAAQAVAESLREYDLDIAPTPTPEEHRGRVHRSAA